MLSVVTWLWTPPETYNRKFTAEHVNTLYNMVKRHYRNDFTFHVFTDDRNQDFAEGVRVHSLRTDFSDVESPLGPHYPSCYRRLIAFSPDFTYLVGPRFVSLDLDCVIVGDVTDLWDRPDDLMFWEGHVPKQPYNGSMWLHRSGTYPAMYDEFDPDRSPLWSRKAGYTGSDQGWFAYVNPNLPTWNAEDGVVSWIKHCKNRMWLLPPGAKIVFFNGLESPWDKSAQDKAAWIKEHYR